VKLASGTEFFKDVVFVLRMFVESEESENQAKRMKPQ
jgi:hypothetical protein